MRAGHKGRGLAEARSDFSRSAMAGGRRAAGAKENNIVKKTRKTSRTSTKSRKRQGDPVETIANSSEPVQSQIAVVGAVPSEFLPVQEALPERMNTAKDAVIEQSVIEPAACTEAEALAGPVEPSEAGAIAEAEVHLQDKFERPMPIRIVDVTPVDVTPVEHEHTAKVVQAMVPEKSDSAWRKFLCAAAGKWSWVQQRVKIRPAKKR